MTVTCAQCDCRTGDAVFLKEYGLLCPDCFDSLQDDDAPACGNPCDPADGNECCASYWARMEREGYWDRQQHRWTDKGWQEMTKWP